MSLRWGGTADDQATNAAGDVLYARRMRFWTARTASKAPSGPEFTAFFAESALTTPVATVVTALSSVSPTGEWGPVYTADGVTLYGGAEIFDAATGTYLPPTTLVEIPPRGPFVTEAVAAGTYGAVLTNAAAVRPSTSLPVLWVTATAPTNKLTNDFWDDTTANLRKRWDGTAWVTTGASTFVAKADGGGSVMPPAAGENPVGSKSLRGPGATGRVLVQFDGANVEGDTWQLVDSSTATFAYQLHVVTGTMSLQGPGDNTDVPASKSLYFEMIGPRPYVLFVAQETGGAQYAVGSRNGAFIISGGDPAPIQGDPGSADAENSVQLQWNMATRTAKVLRGNTWQWFAEDGTTLNASINGANGDMTARGGYYLTSTGVGRLQGSGTIVIGTVAASHVYIGETADTGQLILRRNVAFEAGHLLGFYGTAPIAKRAATADATDLATVITLANALKADLVAYGLKTA